MVEVLDNIERVERPSAARLRELVALARPFICSGLFEPPRREVFGDARINGPLAALTVAEYWASKADLGRASVGARVSPALEAELLAIARAEPIASPDPTVTVWLGRVGSKQRFHCDMDCAGIFLGQVFGTKRVCLVSPMESQKIQPGIDRELLLAEVPFHTSSPAEMLRFLRYVEGFDGILHEHETLYIPPLWWHFVEYLSDSLSISWHTRAHPAHAELSTAWPLLWKHEWPLWQGIVTQAITDPAALERARAVMRALAAGDGGDELHALHRALCPERYVQLLHASDAAVLQIRRQRPLPSTATWRADDVPHVQPYIRFATVAAGEAPRALVVLDGHRVAGEVPLDEDTSSIAIVAAALQERTGTTVAELAASLECEIEDLCAVLALLSEKGWVSAGTGVTVTGGVGIDSRR
jgi:hypothetical protein